MRLPKKNTFFYKIIVTINEKIYKIIKCSKDYDYIYNLYLKHCKKSEKILTKVNYIHNNNEINNVNIYIYLVSNNPKYRNEKFFSDDEMYVVKKQRYNVNEKYFLKHKKKRLTYEEINSLYFNNKFLIYLLIHNKILIIENFLVSEIIICKTKKDAIFLHEVLKYNNPDKLFLSNYSNNFKEKILIKYIKDNKLNYNYFSNNKTIKNIYL